MLPQPAACSSATPDQPAQRLPRAVGQFPALAGMRARGRPKPRTFNVSQATISKLAAPHERAVLDEASRAIEPLTKRTPSQSRSSIQVLLFTLENDRTV